MIPSTRRLSSTTGKLGCGGLGTGEERGGAVKRHGHGYGFHRGRHHFAHAGQRERINPVFADEMVPAPRDLFGEDRAPHQQNGHCVCRPQAAISGSSTWVLPVSSTAKKVAVSGERIVPPMVAAIASSAQKPGLADGS